MQSGRDDTLEERYAIKFCFKLGKNAATETYGILQTVFGPSCMNRASVNYLTKMGIKTVPHPLNSQYLTPCDFCLFPKLRGCRYETNEEMKEAMMKVIDTLTQEDFHGPSRRCVI